MKFISPIGKVVSVFRTDCGSLIAGLDLAYSKLDNFYAHPEYVQDYRNQWLDRRVERLSGVQDDA